MKAQKLSLLPASMTNKSLTFRQGLVFILSNFKVGWWAGNSIKPIITHPTNIDYLSRLTVPAERLQVAFATRPRSRKSPLQQVC